MSLFQLLYHSGRAMGAATRGVATASNNVSNANTPGYARETLTLQTRDPLQHEGLLLGQGVNLGEVVSSYDRFSQTQVFGRLGGHSYSESRAAAFESVEGVVASAGIGDVGAAVQQLFDAFSELESAPGEIGPRLAVLQAGEELTELMNHHATSLTEHQNQFEGQAVSQVTSINSLATTVATLNDRILELEAGGQQAADLRAQRTAALEDLSRLGPVRFSESPDGSSRVIFAEHTLVEAGTTRALQLVPDPVTGLSQVHISMSSSTMDITSTLDSGELGATLQLRDTVIPGVLADLDALAFNVATEVNTLHAAGFGLDGVTGRNFFVPPALLAGSALALELDPAVIDTPDALAAATTPAGVPGDNSNATALAALSGTLIMSAGTQTFNSFWATALSSLGHDSATAQNDQLRAEIELSTALDVRDSASGVVLEEEALDLLRYQDAYQAATRIMSATQEMLDELLQMV